MLTVGAFEAKTKLSELLDAVERGEEVTITRRGEPIAKLVPLTGNAARLHELIDGIKATRDASGLKDTTIEEILEWRKQGRR